MYTQKKLSRTSGFTIVELLIVIVVIAILAAISIVVYTGIQEHARSAAHQQEASQAERQIMTHAALEGNDATDISGKLVGYQEGAGEKELISPLSGTPDITMYTVCNAISTTSSYGAIAYLLPESANHRFRLSTDAAGTTRLNYRIDTSAQGNATGRTANVLIVGNTIIGWLRVGSNLTTRASGWNQAAANNSTTLSPGTGFDFNGIRAVADSSCTAQAALVFSAAHDQATRAAVISWLAEKYDVSL